MPQIPPMAKFLKEERVFASKLFVGGSLFLLESRSPELPLFQRGVLKKKFLRPLIFVANS